MHVKTDVSQQRNKKNISNDSLIRAHMHKISAILQISQFASGMLQYQQSFFTSSSSYYNLNKYILLLLMASLPTFSQIPTTSTFNSSYPTYPYSSHLNYQPSSTLSRSRILQQNKYAPNEQLYSPLKNAITTNTIDTTRMDSRRGDFVEAARKSRVITEYRPVSQVQVESIRNNTFMIEEPLRPTSNYQKVQGKQFYVLDAHQKLGSPIDQMQFKQRLSASRQKQVIVYEPTGQPLVSQVTKTSFEPLSLAPTKQKQKYIPKYNLYSCLDEPYERIKRFGCKGFTCPANECIAATRRRDWLD